MDMYIPLLLGWKSQDCASFPNLTEPWQLLSRLPLSLEKFPKMLGHWVQAPLPSLPPEEEKSGLYTLSHPAELC